MQKQTPISCPVETVQILLRSLEDNSGVASPEIWGGPKDLGVAKMFDFRQITLFSLEKCLSKHKMTIFSENWGGGLAPFAPPGYAYA